MTVRHAFYVQTCNYGKIVPKRSRLKVTGGPKATKPFSGSFPFYRPFKGDYFSSMDLEIVVHVRLKGVKNVDLLDKLSGPQFGDRCPLN